MAQITMHTRVGWMPYADEYPRKGMLIMSIHHLDAFRFLFGDPESVTTTVRSNPDSEDEVDEMAVYTLAYPDGLLAVAIDNTYATLDQGIEWRVDGSGGMARGTVGWMDHPWGSPSTLRYIDAERPDAAIEPRWTERWFPDAFSATMAEVLRAVQNGGTPSINGRDNLGRWRCSRRPTAPPNRGARSRSPRSRSDARQFDYVVVGAGSAGCAVAGRLSEDPAVEVALVEAGPSDSNPAIHVPARFWEQQKSTLDWDFESEPEPALNGRRTYLPRGRVLGGTSSMNTMLYVRGAAEDYDSWARAGCEGWWFKDCCRCSSSPRTTSAARPTSTAPAARSGRGPRGSGAAQPLGRRRRRGRPPAQRGLQRRDPGRGRRLPGDAARRAPRQQLDRLHRPQSRAAEPDRPHLHPGAAVAVDRRTGLGVEIDRYGEAEFIRAGREVIVAGGAYLSPQLLMLSGIGPADHLREMGIEPVLDNPAVGENLQDHPGCFLNYPARLPKDGGEGWIEAGGFARTEDGPLPDVQFHAAAGSFGDEGVSTGRAPTLSFGPYVTRPKSRGRVWLRSPLPQAKPRIHHNFLSHPDDVEVLRRGVRMAMSIAESPSLRDVLADPADAIAAGQLPRSDSHAAIEAHMRATAFSSTTRPAPVRSEASSTARCGCWEWRE